MRGLTTTALAGGNRRSQWSGRSLWSKWFASPRSYQPTALRTPVFLVLLSIMVLLIVLVEYACRTLPTKQLAIKELPVEPHREELQARSPTAVPLSMVDYRLPRPLMRRQVAVGNGTRPADPPPQISPDKPKDTPTITPPISHDESSSSTTSSTSSSKTSKITNPADDPFDSSWGEGGVSSMTLSHTTIRIVRPTKEWTDPTLVPSPSPSDGITRVVFASATRFLDTKASTPSRTPGAAGATGAIPIRPGDDCGPGQRRRLSARAQEFVCAPDDDAWLDPNASQPPGAHLPTKAVTPNPPVSKPTDADAGENGAPPKVVVPIGGPKPDPKGGESTDHANEGRFLDPKAGQGATPPASSVDPNRFLDPKAGQAAPTSIQSGDPNKFLDAKAGQAAPTTTSSADPNKFLGPKAGKPRKPPLGVDPDKFLDEKAGNGATPPASSVDPNRFLDAKAGQAAPSTTANADPNRFLGEKAGEGVVPPASSVDPNRFLDDKANSVKSADPKKNLQTKAVTPGAKPTEEPGKGVEQPVGQIAGLPSHATIVPAGPGQPTDTPVVINFAGVWSNQDAIATNLAWLPPQTGPTLTNLIPFITHVSAFMPTTAGTLKPDAAGATPPGGQPPEPHSTPPPNWWLSSEAGQAIPNGPQDLPPPPPPPPDEDLAPPATFWVPPTGGSASSEPGSGGAPVVIPVVNGGGKGNSEQPQNNGQSNPGLGAALNALNPASDGSGSGGQPNINPILNAVAHLNPTMTTASEAFLPTIPGTFLPTNAGGPPAPSNQGQPGDAPRGGNAPDGGVAVIVDGAMSVGGNILSAIGRPDMASRLQGNPQGGPAPSPGAGGVFTTVIQPTPIVTSISGTLTTISRPPEAVIYMPGSRVTASVAGPMITSSVPEQVVTTRIPGRMVTTSIDGREVVTSLPESVATRTIPGSVVTTQGPGAMITGYVPGHYIKTVASGSYIVSSVPGTVLTTMVGGQEVLTTLPASLRTISVPGYMTTMVTGGSVITTSVPGSQVVSTIAGSLITSSVPGYMTTMSVAGAVVMTTAPESEVMTTLPGTMVTTMVNGQLVATSIPGAVVKTKVPGSTFLTTLPGSLVTTSISGSMITTRLPDSVITTSVSGSTFETTVGGSLVTTSISGSLVVTSLPGSVVRTRVSGTLITTSISGRHVTIPATAQPGGTSTRGSAAQATGVYGTGPNRLDRPVRDLNPARYFAGSYLPTLMAVILRITVGTIYAAVKMMEPFYCLSEPGGATARESLNLYYLQPNRELGTFTAMFRGHWVVLFVSILYMGVGLLVPFSSEFLSFQKFTNVYGAWGPELYVHTAIGRVVQGLLAFAAVSLIGLWYLQRTRRSSGIYCDPSSIATVASLLHHPEVIRDLRQLPPDATSLEMNRLLGDNRYQLGTYRAIDGRDRYGLMPAQGPASRAWLGLRRNEYTRVRGNEDDDSQNGSRSGSGSRSASNERRRPSHQRDRMKKGVNYHHARIVRDVLFVLLSCGILVLILYYWSVGKDSGFERFMSSQSFGPRFVMSLCGMLVHSEWKRVERELCVLEPFRALAKGESPAHASMLVPRTLSPVTTIFTALWRRHYVVSMSAFMAILAEILIISLGSIPFNEGKVHRSFIGATWLSVSILGLMMISLGIIYIRRHRPHLPRSPETIGAVLSYLCGARMLQDYSELSKLDRNARDRWIVGLKRTYTLNKELGVDDQIRWCVDYDGPTCEG
ncbi:MAG: hypothetical protein M1823_005551 [Watsoniomyces obsoletus]|nr:MAG: hypothetical protein M1823_005551 [Watsoniomyces obsoletus]